MNEWATVTFDEFLTHHEELEDGALAFAAREPPPPVRLSHEPFQALVARTNCTLRITQYVRNHREAFWGAGLLQDRGHVLRVQHRLLRAVHAYFTNPSQVTDPPDPPTSEIIRTALADKK